jgi:hypothetical protein
LRTLSGEACLEEAVDVVPARRSGDLFWVFSCPDFSPESGKRGRLFTAKTFQK